MNKLTHSELAQLITARPGAFPVGILAETDARLLKTNNPNKNARKTVRTVGFVGANYQKAVRREGERQGAEQAENFVAKARPWGEWVKGAEGKIATHKGQLYLRTQSTPGQRDRTRTRVLNYRGEDGKFLKFEEVKPFLPAKSYSARQADVGIDGQGEQVNVNEYGFASLKKVRIAGKTYEIVSESAPAPVPAPVKKETKNKTSFFARERHWEHEATCDERHIFDLEN